MIRILLIVTLLSGVALGQTPTPTPAPQPAPAPALVVPVATLTAPTTIEAGQQLILTADASVFVGRIRWKVKPKVAVQLFDQGGRGNVLCLANNLAPGTYRFDITVKGTGLTEDGFDDDTDSADVTVIDRPKPKPTPPTPDPTPSPVPAPPVPAPVVSKGWHVTLVVDPNAPVATQQALAPLADSVTIAGSTRAIGGIWHKQDVGSADFAKWNINGGMTGLATPALVVQDATGKVQAKVSCPATEAGVLAYLKSIAGGQ